MRAKIIFLALAVAGSVAATWFAFGARAGRRAVERELEAVAARRGRAETGQRDAERRVADANEESRQLQAQLEDTRNKAAIAAKAAKPAQAEPPRKAAPAWLPATVLREALLNDPQMQNLQLAVTHSRLTATYEPLRERLKLSGEQMTRLLENLRKRTEQEMDFSAMMETKRFAAGDPAAAKFRQQMADEFRAAQTSLLGEAGWQQFEAYERSVPLRTYVNELAGSATVMGTALSGAQAEALVEIMTQASPAYRQGGNAALGTLDWEQALTGAVAVLAEPQLAVFRNSAIQMRNMERMRQLARRSPGAP